jgi:tripartite-type tricarboxylate transporter receptor subunit TctC
MPQNPEGGMTMLGMTVRGAVLALLALAIGSHSSVVAQTFPSKPITIVVSIGAGTGMDVVTRIYAEKLSAAIGQSVVVENRPGAATMLAATQVASAPADGHTLVVLTSGALSINPALYKKINYDPVNGFVPISLYVKAPFILVVNPKLPAKNALEFIAHAKKANPPVTYATLGAGAIQHLCMEFAKNRFGFEATMVPYKNTGQSVTDIASGQVDSAFVEAGASLPLINDGRLRALAVSSSNRLPLLPNVPPFAEAANAPGFEAVSWHMLLAPAKTPRPIVERLHNEMKKIMADKSITEKTAAIGLIPMESPSIQGMQDYLKSEREKWGGLVEKLGLKGTL